MIKIFRSLNQFTNNISKQIKFNSIQPISSNIAYGYYFPNQWTIDYIYSLLDPRKTNILQIERIKNRVGQYNSKIMLKFTNQQTMNKYIKKYNEDYIQTKDSVQRVVIKPFQLKTQSLKKIKNQKNLKFGIKVKNLDFQITKNQLLKLASDYGQVQHIDLEEKNSELNRGFGKIYFKTHQELMSFFYFIDGLNYRGRRIKAEIIEAIEKNKDENQQHLQYPKIVFQANIQLLKRSIKKQ